jgi:hypothetical protein
MIRVSPMIGRCSIHDVAQWGRIGIAQLIGKKNAKTPVRGYAVA